MKLELVDITNGVAKFNLSSIEKDMGLVVEEGGHIAINRDVIITSEDDSINGSYETSILLDVKEVSNSGYVVLKPILEHPIKIHIYQYLELKVVPGFSLVIDNACKSV